MNHKQTKQLAQRLKDGQTSKKGTPELPKAVGGERSHITRLHNDKVSKLKSLETKPVKSSSEVETHLKTQQQAGMFMPVNQQNTYIPLPGSPGFNSF